MNLGFGDVLGGEVVKEELGVRDDSKWPGLSRETVSSSGHVPLSCYS